MFYPDHSLWEALIGADLTTQSSAKVCELCFEKVKCSSNTRWLTWLQCASPKEHQQAPQITVVVGGGPRVVKVRELLPTHLKSTPSHLTLCCTPSGTVCGNPQLCPKPHSHEELEYWKWCICHKLLGKVNMILMDIEYC